MRLKSVITSITLLVVYIYTPCFVCAQQHTHKYHKNSSTTKQTNATPSVSKDFTLTLEEKERIIDTFAPNMVFVKGDSYTMGVGMENSDYKEIPRRVTVMDFYISSTEVTQEQWVTVMGNNPSVLKGRKLPVTNVSYNDCMEFLRKLQETTGIAFRLPTEVEWEYACVGGDYSKAYIYSGSSDINKVAWWEGNSNGVIHPVAQKSPNELELYDMSGNVWELCSDWFVENAQRKLPFAAEPNTEKVIRGGAYSAHFPFMCLPSYRLSMAPNKNSEAIGFRLVTDVVNQTTFNQNQKVIDIEKTISSAIQGEADSQNLLGYMYFNGTNGMAQDFNKAFEWYEKSAKQGNGDAQSQLGLLYENGLGIAMNKSKAVGLYKKSAQQNNVYGIYNLARMYQSGVGVALDNSKAMELFNKAANLGYALAQNALADEYYAQKNYGLARMWYENAVRGGDSKAGYSLGMMYFRGEGVPQDYRNALELYRSSANKGYAGAYFMLAGCYFEGYGCEKNVLLALKYAQLSINASPNNIESYCMKGYMYCRMYEMRSAYQVYTVIKSRFDINSLWHSMTDDSQKYILEMRDYENSIK